MESIERLRECSISGDVKSIYPQVEKGVSVLQERGEETRDELECIGERLEYLEGLYNKREEMRRESERVLVGVKRRVLDMWECTHSGTLRRCLGGVDSVFSMNSVMDEMERDIESIEREVSVLRERRECLIGMLKYIPVQLRQVEVVRDGLSRGELSEDERLALILLRESGVVYFSEVDKYKAFEGVESVFDIESVMGQELVGVLDGVRISEPVGVSMGLPTGFSYCDVSLSQWGTCYMLLQL